jgi:hypothetical protein
VAVTSADYAAANEALKLEAARLDVQLKQVQLAAAGKAPPMLTITAAPPPAALPAPADPSQDDAQDVLASLHAIQEKYAADLTPEKLRDAEALAATVRSVTSEVAALHGLSDHLDSFAARYADAAAKRIAESEGVSLAYEVNRMVNAANFEAMKLAHGVKVKVRWSGGANDGQTRAIGEPWTGTLRHPPLTVEETNCFITLETK